MIIGIGCDHAGFHLKERVNKWLLENGYSIRDFGTTTEESVDYPDFAHAVSQSIEQGDTNMGVLICGTGIGMTMSANRHKGIRAALCKDGNACEMARKHNDANVLCIGARNTNPAILFDMLGCFFNTEFEGGRHQKRIEKI
tara:strand:+ start:5394 stop:5816 length:423 start_codon:yes stop_codon:yes gene_type:complete